MKRTFKISKDRLYKLIHVEKMTQKQIAEKFGVSRSAVCRKQKKYEIISLKNYEKKSPKKLTDIQKKVLYGSILGDDCIYRYKTTVNSSLLCYHSISQKKYVELKFFIWKKFINYKKPKVIRRKKGTRVHFQTICHPEFEEMRKQYYRGKKKIIRKNHLERLSDVSLAFWFMDDGSRCKNGGLAIHTNCFELNEVEMSCNYFKEKYGFKCWPQKRKENQYVIFFSNKTSLDLAEMILPYMPNFMRYKLEGVYNYSKNPQRLYAMPFILLDLLDKSESEDIV